MSAIAVVAGEYPAASETFVWREVEALRGADRSVSAIGLRPAGSPAEGVPPADGFVYGPDAAETFGRFLLELLQHPLRSAQTLAMAMKDAVLPGESMRLASRVKLIGQAAAGIGLARRLWREGVTHVHCHFAHAPASVGMYAARQMGRPFTFTGHANDLFQRRALLRRKLQRAAGVACISRWHADWYQSIEPTCGTRCRVIRCGVDVADDTPRPILAEPTVRLISVGRLVPKKGFDLLIRALARLHADQPDRFQLTIVGDGPEAAALHGLAGELDCGAAVTFAGAQPHGRVRELLGEADMFVMPCRTDPSGDRDGIPVAMMEAMAAGRPVIAGDQPAIRELIIDGETGRMVGKDVEQLAEGIRSLADDAARARRLAAAGYEHVRQEFATSVNLQRLMDMIGGAAAQVDDTTKEPMAAEVAASR